MTMLLYKGGAKSNVRGISKLIFSGELGSPLMDRVELVSKLHAEIRAGLASGFSRAAAHSQISVLRFLFQFADQADLPMTMDNVTEVYGTWADHLFHRTRMHHHGSTYAQRRADGALSRTAAYGYGALVGSLLDKVLERHTRIIELTRLEPRHRRRSAIGVNAEKQNLHETFVFGHLLQDICDGLTIENTFKTPTPFSLRLRDGNEIICHEDKASSHLTWEDTSLKSRYPIANLRLEAELFMFIGQTGMNMTQAHNLQLQQFFYASHLESYQVREYKNRRGGTVLFEIFKDYKPHFERFLEWRSAAFPDSKRLFPFIGNSRSRVEIRGTGARLRKLCHRLKMRYVSPRLLRNTRVNWLLRMTGNADLTAEMAQHTKQTLLEVYEYPSLQRAIVETTKFWSTFDPLSTSTLSVAPGGCNGSAQQADGVPSRAPKPNCITPSGCLWCVNHRDVDSLDYVWSLATFRHLKMIEVSKSLPVRVDAESSPAQLVVFRLNDKLRWFESSNAVRSEWVEESLARVTEGDFHSSFRDEIIALEGKS
ncbi:hypothetical protein J2794_006579 [Paraburkholderia terricola]|uniref:site-specific integrase n=1 Tax=Paraburkholderia terricola TaxID=169427 RepID=UPI0028594A87|nr:site-specific integrase [Paraburkholderia terricola]MDR6450438.1 hypothetical protein [Paraburkholderia terricola]